LSVLHIQSHIQNMCFTQIFPKRKFSIELKNLLSTYLKYMIQIWIPFKSVLKICICFQIWCRHKYFNMWSICIKICVTICVWQKSAIFSSVMFASWYLIGLQSSLDQCGVVLEQYHSEEEAAPTTKGLTLDLASDKLTIVCRSCEATKSVGYESQGLQEDIHAAQTSRTWVTDARQVIQGKRCIKFTCFLIDQKSVPLPCSFTSESWQFQLCWRQNWNLKFWYKFQCLKLE